MPTDKKTEKKLTELLVARKAVYVVRDSVENFVQRYDNERDACQIFVRLESLDKMYQEFHQVQSEIEKIDDAEMLDTHLIERSDLETRYCVAKGFLLSRRAPDLNQTGLNTSIMPAPHTPSNTFHLRLPKIDLPKFNGDFTKWLSFRDTFSSMVHSNADIPMVAKLQYLLQSLQGEAQKPFESVDIEADNYASVWDALLKRYDNRRFLKKQLFRSIYDLPQMKRESAQELHELIDEFQRHVKALAKLEEPIQYWDTPLINILCYKLDPASLRAWEERSSQMEEVSYDALIEFLHQRVRILKSVESDLLQRSQFNHTRMPGVNQIHKKGFPPITVANAVASQSNPSVPSCVACRENHYLFQCSTFEKMSVSQRRELITQRKLCWNCFRTGHQARTCGSKYKCRVCHDRHHTLLHDFSPSNSSPAVTIPVPEQQPNPPSFALPGKAGPSNVQVSLAVQSRPSTVLLETVSLHVVDDYGHIFEARALLDCASMSNFISKRLANLLCNRQSKVNVNVAGIGQSLKTLKRTITAIVKSRVSPFSTKLEFLVIETPTNDLPTVPVQVSSWNLPNVALADPKFHTTSQIDVIIGGETYWELHTGKKISLGSGQPQAIETLFGWTVSGSTYQDASPTTKECFVSTAESRLEDAVQRFWELETLVEQNTQSLSEKRCEEFYAPTTIKNSSGRYVVRLPKTENTEIVLGNSRLIAERRFHSLERRLDRDPVVKSSYHQFMHEYEQLGHMRRICDPVDDSIEHCYLPHHPVFKLSSTTTKTRVVFDASCKTASGYSLNDCLLVGPVVQQDLLSLVMRFRTHAIALVADIEKMYRQVQVHSEDRPLQRILWRNNVKDPIASYELQTVTYGTASAPYLATKTLKQLSIDESHNFPAAADPVSNDFYVDDFLSGAEDVQTAREIQRQVTLKLCTAGFPLKKWASNSSDVLKGIPSEDRAIQPFVDMQDEQSISTLGLIWEPKTDTFRFKVDLPLPAAVLTKRNVMSYIAQIFDPLGLVGHTIMKAKLFMQHLWTLRQADGNRFDWDQPLPPKLQNAWKEFHTTIDILRQIKIPRFVSLPSAIKFELHFFADASERAYGTCCYVRAETTHQISVQLMASKCKVTPLSTHHTIARLELCAARLATQLYKKVSGSLKISPTQVHFWSDSTTVLQWLRSAPGRWKTFVANRVSYIQQATTIDNWKHIAGVDNPADDISRGLNPPEIVNSTRWWTGPSWLTLASEFWPVGALPTDELPETRTEGKNVPLVAMSTTQCSFNEYLFARYSDYSPLRRTTAYCLRYLQNLRNRSIVRKTNPTLKNFFAADIALCRMAQQDSFWEERNNIANGIQLSKPNTLKWLKPFLDSMGVIRVGGRLDNAALSEKVKHPILLKGNHPLSTLIANYYHKVLLHAGPQLMLGTLRQKYWFLGGRNLVRQVYHKCHTCFRFKPVLIKQSTADLPASHVTPTRPFSVCGIDYCGPFFIKSAARTRGPTKVYVAIFICFSTRAVHIELVGDLSTAAFLAALRRLVARRGIICELHSDNATAFKGAAHALNKVYRMLKLEEPERNKIFDWCANHGIKWKFIPPRAPHFGGLWEAAVKSTKFYLLKSVEMCLNSRPITPIPSESSDLEALTPGHFLVGSNLQAVSEPPLISIPANRLNHWEQTQQHVQRIWARWYPEYLQQLQSRASNSCSPPVKIEPGRIVVVREDNVPPTKWPLAKITAIHPGKDGIVRVVTLKTAAADNVVRPVAKIALLPMPTDGILPTIDR
ncbi:uncharacterized protein LOC128739969 [Sabethes cyaneus]|uniref:uncharacterized protein LOC128739969 n=1 Tax=Sabethes cyaneus TaxID=53552 RepID=UPI00237D51F5|nr:uncharacterized protein LOC128739969 [Sabethes cyaneus]